MQRKFFSLKKAMLVAVLLAGITGTTATAQQVLTIDNAMDIAAENSPALRRSYMNLERYRQILIAQRASLKSRFSLSLTPVGYNRDRRFENRLSQWYTNENFNTSGIFRVDQPILWTDGEISLVNTFSWQDNTSNVDGVKTSNQAFRNQLNLEINQPLFTYNRRKMELKQIEFDLENAHISYALQRLNTESQITSRFYAVYTAQNNLEISKEELGNAEQSYDIIKNKVEADLAARDELFQAELNLATARSSVEDNTLSLANAKDQLKQTLGMDLSEEIFVVAETKIEPVQIDVEKAISYGLSCASNFANAK